MVTSENSYIPHARILLAKLVLALPLMFRLLFLRRPRCSTDAAGEFAAAAAARAVADAAPLGGQERIATLQTCICDTRCFHGLDYNPYWCAMSRGG